MNKPYPKYKHSGAEWLGDVPEHWEEKRLRFLVDSIEQGWSPQANSTPANEGELGVLKLSAVNHGQFLPHENKMIEEIPFDQGVIFPEKGDILITRANTPELVGDSCCLNETYRNLIIADLIYRLKIKNTRVDGFYLVYFLLTREGRVQIESSARGANGSMVKLGQSHLKDFLILLPPLPEQQAIAAFLDRETGRIDALIAKKIKLLELLAEQRIALISRAVTKGLETSGKLKPSGVEWLGDVPEHWEIKALRYICRIETGDKDTVDAEDDGDYPFFVRSQTVEKINSFTKNCEAVLTAGDGVGVGKVFHYYDGKFDFHQRVYLFSNFKKVTGRFFFLFLKENFWRVALEGGAKSTVDSLRRPMIASFPFALPPLPEQQAIAAFLDRETAKIDALSAKVTTIIERLKEYRTALISSAVTGKIDVREVV
ncbi:MAG: HsdS protein [candidate division Kazan bacterium GW2011_GWC1_52_13]|nr:MAG: HsdS protein [candidate division Kazan bacterium GW2011_GWC1_52_13]